MMPRKLKTKSSEHKAASLTVLLFALVVGVIIISTIMGLVFVVSAQRRQVVSANDYPGLVQDTPTMKSKRF